MAAGWDVGRVYTARITSQEDSEESDFILGGNDGDLENISLAAVEQRFYEFIREFVIDDNFVYRDQLRANLIVQRYFLEVELEHIQTADEVLANLLRQRPAEFLPIVEGAAKRMALQIVPNLSSHSDLDAVPDIQVMILSNSNVVPIRDLTASKISKLVRVAGIIINASALSAKATHIQIMCRSCRHVKVLPVHSGFSGVQLPRKCDSEPLPGVTKDCPIDPYTIVHDRSKFVDQQSLKLQETSDMIPVGELPRPILLSVDRHLANKVVPGARITVTGIYATFQSKQNRSQGGAVAIRNSYIRVVGIHVDRDRNGREGRSFSAEEEEKYIAMSRRPDLYELFAKSIAPSIFGSSDIKKAICCLLFGGTRNVLPDGLRLRGDINVLLLGDPGTAKSQLLKFVEQIAPIAIYTSGKGSSAAGLTASVVRDPGTREFYLEGGAMVLADGGVVCIDEFDKMREEDRVAIHEAMEQQTISIAKAGITTILNSRTSVLAAANPVFGRYDDMKAPGENIDFQTTILSRFDLIFIVRDEHNHDRDLAIARHVIGVHQNKPILAHEAVGDIDIQTMRGYIRYCRTKCAPRLGEAAATKLRDHYVMIRKEVKDLERETKKRATIPITVRQLEAVIRLSEALAKLRLSPIATDGDIDEALRLFKYSTIDAIKAGNLDGLSRAEVMSQVQQAEDAIRKRVPIGTRTTERVLKDYLISQLNMTDSTVGKALDILIRRGTLQYERRRMVLTRVAY
ncbi:MCM-domain-containing protein [Gonapodya prolifera JEL478]|uniref:DNA replication licensing factor MCM5 n=1 Tax=Gonapodya prolifera (strain JEL478) TaxID=1344416 RepID=A0A139AZG8_GONPJ|nr:MCM-domain-containing protein [Gonapodya prolifera JEL478]|eukprot:KXS22138.1 MCM-domain-containing protein [Gonapodya prolifera JEL478]